MTATVLYRIAAVLFLLFATGHTLGFLNFKPANQEGVAVFEGMTKVRLAIGNGQRTYNDFYRGFGLYCTAYLLFAAYLAWFLGGLARSNPAAVGTLGWAFFVLQLVSLGLSWIYFLPPPVILSVLVSICTGWAAWLVKAA
ncbi:MAG TPA: hypothetical protein VKW06_18085 [Candidatus Angelobacter sp.]|nr:hypothetical protein [Candidatus Angelobacter sp.]